MIPSRNFIRELSASLNAIRAGSATVSRDVLVQRENDAIANTVREFAQEIESEEIVASGRHRDRGSQLAASR